VACGGYTGTRGWGIFWCLAAKDTPPLFTTNHLHRAFKPATNSTDFRIRIANDSNTRYNNLAAFNSDNASFGNNAMAISGGQNSSTSSALIVLNIYDYANTTTMKTAFSSSYTNNGTNSANVNLLNNQHAYNQTGAISQINLFCGSGNFTSGDYFLLGVK
jgi:hypothetical protein